MKSKSQELLDKSLAAMLAAIEIYNKPQISYREETFAILAVNAWELCLKAKALADNGNKLRIIYVKERRSLRDGTKAKKETYKLTRSGNPLTHSVDFLAKKLIAAGRLPEEAWRNLEALIEIRDNSVHFYNHSGTLRHAIQEIGMACIRNYVNLCKVWFACDFSQYNLVIMPLSFVAPPSDTEAVVLNNEERRFVAFLERLTTESRDRAEGVADYSVAVNVDLRFVRSKSDQALRVAIGHELGLPEIRLTEEQVLERYPWTSEDLVVECRHRYSDFKVTQYFYNIRRPLMSNRRYCHVRLLDPDKPSGSKKNFYSPMILEVLDQYYTKVEAAS